MAFSQGHWQYPERAHGDKRNKEDLQRWRGLAAVGKQTDRFLLNEQAEILDIFKEKGTWCRLMGGGDDVALELRADGTMCMYKYL